MDILIMNKDIFGMKKLNVVIAAFTFLGSSAMAASFDCGKARRPLEKLICSSPELDAADTRMGEVYKAISKSFPVAGFIAINQRMFLSDYSYCMSNSIGQPEASAVSVKKCVGVVQQRIAELERFGSAKVYSNAVGKFTPDSLIILTYASQGKTMIRLWGNWMPDAYEPKPYPDGKICDLEGALTPAKGGFVTNATDDAVFRITDSSLKITDHIMCSARNGIAEGEYKRFK